MPDREYMNIVVVGHVDHGKSTIIGRLMADTGSLPEGKLEQIRETCRRNAKPFEYAFLLDALKDEQSQGITIDTARCFFKTNRRDYIIIDAPGHVEFLKNMITGAARAEAALLVIDASEGVKENSTRHGYMLSMLGIKQVAILVNKMDLVGYREAVFQEIVQTYSAFLNQIHIEPSAFIPVSGAEGVNIVRNDNETSWYEGPAVLDILDKFNGEKLPEDKSFRMPVQGVYKFTKDGDNRRIVAGTLETGELRAGDEVVFYPSGKTARVKTLESFNTEPLSRVTAGYAAGFTLTEQIYITRGELAARAGELKPKVTTRVRAHVFWLGKKNLQKKHDYTLKLGTARANVRLEEVIRVMDASDLRQTAKEYVGRHEVAEVILKLERAVAFDLAEDIASTGRFVLVDQYEIAGGGVVLEALSDREGAVREQVSLRNYKWEKSIIHREERAEKYNQKATLILITGGRGVGKKAIAKTLEQRLFAEGKYIYFLGIGNLRYGVDADIIGKPADAREEHIRRLSEVANIALDMGSLLVVTAVELMQVDLDLIKTVIEPDRILVIWLGESITTDIAYDLYMPSFETEEQAALRVKRLLQDNGRIFKGFD